MDSEFGKVKRFSNVALFWVISAIQWYNETTNTKFKILEYFNLLDFKNRWHLAKNLSSKKWKADAKYLKLIFSFKNKIWKAVRSYEPSSHTEMTWR